MLQRTNSAHSNGFSRSLQLEGQSNGTHHAIGELCDRPDDAGHPARHRHRRLISATTDRHRQENPPAPSPAGFSTPFLTSQATFERVSLRAQRRNDDHDIAVNPSNRPTYLSVWKRILCSAGFLPQFRFPEILPTVRVAVRKAWWAFRHQSG